MKTTHLPRNGARTRVLHVFGSLQRGGAEMRTLEVLRRLDPQRFSFAMVALSGQRGELADQAEADGFVVEPCVLGAGFAARFTALLRRLEVEVLHSHVHYASGYLLWLAKRAGVRQRIAHFRNTSDGQGRGVRRRVQRAVMRRLLDRYATDILAVSEGTMAEAWCADWPADQRCRVILNGLDTSPFAAAAAPVDVRREFAWSATSSIYINVASFQPAKNQLRVVDVFHQIARRQDGARLLLVGREVNGYQAKVREAVERRGLAANVTFAGERADVPRLLKASDVLLFPSKWEGLPGVVLESCAAGLPVVASDIPGVREIGRHFPAVRRLSLTESDGVWAQHAIEAAAAPRQHRGTAFEDTPFALGRAAASLRAVYERAG
jgi:glycosyltransferase involved in cell wall biosynthesis